MASQSITAADHVRRAFVRISSIRTNIGQQFHIGESIVREYADALGHLQEAGFDVSEFQIPANWLERRVVVSGPYGKQYGNERSVDRERFLIKLDAVLACFSMAKTKIGFKAS